MYYNKAVPKHKRPATLKKLKRTSSNTLSLDKKQQPCARRNLKKEVTYPVGGSITSAPS